DDFEPRAQWLASAGNEPNRDRAKQLHYKEKPPGGIQIGKAQEAAVGFWPGKLKGWRHLETRAQSDSPAECIPMDVCIRRGVIEISQINTPWSHADLKFPTPECSV